MRTVSRSCQGSSVAASTAPSSSGFQMGDATAARSAIESSVRLILKSDFGLTVVPVDGLPVL
jgi:hypothetical protein